MLIVRRIYGVERLTSYHEVAGNLLSIIGTLYAVLLGFVIVDAMERQQELRVIVEQEANGVANVFLLANGLSADKREVIQKSCAKYVSAVINQEWEAMNSGTYSPAALESAWALWTNLTELKPSTPEETTLHDKLLDQLSQLSDNRRIRIVSAAHGVAPAMWFILIVGGAFTVVFTYFFAVQNLKVQLLMTTLVSLTLALNVLLVFLYGSPFTGELAVKPDAFKLDLLIFQAYNQQKSLPNPKTYGVYPPSQPLRELLR
jgi:Na+/melibiose symporter-like transporter